MKPCKSENFREKEVINLSDGRRLGYVTEIEFDICTGKITAIIVCGEGSFFGKGKKDIVIPWCNIEKIGADIILVRAESCLCPPDGKDRCDPNIGTI